MIQVEEAVEKLERKTLVSLVLHPAAVPLEEGARLTGERYVVSAIKLSALWKGEPAVIVHGVWLDEPPKDVGGGFILNVSMLETMLAMVKENPSLGVHHYTSR